MVRKRDTRTEILRAASRRFDREGFHAVSVDAVSSAAGVAKMTLYRHFATKDDLIVACLERSNARFEEWVEETMGDGAPRERLLRLFVALDAMTRPSSFAGVSYQRVFLELDEAHPARAVASGVARRLVAQLAEVCAEAGIRDADAVGGALYLVLTGAFVSARQETPGDPTRHASTAARALLGAS